MSNIIAFQYPKVPVKTFETYLPLAVNLTAGQIARSCMFADQEAKAAKTKEGKDDK